MKQLKTTVVYSVPEWEYCNKISKGEASSETCRFCIKHKGNFVCVLHNMPLEAETDKKVRKTYMCIKATVGFRIPKIKRGN